MKRGFTLIEMLVVIGIIAVLVAASLMGFSKVHKSAERARARELVDQVKTSLEYVFDSKGVWPKLIREKSAQNDSILDEEVAYYLAQEGLLTASYREDGGQKDGIKTGKTTGIDRFGVLSPWGADAMKRTGATATLSTPVNSVSTIKDHLLRFKVDYDGDGVIPDANVGGQTVRIRAHVAVWCAGKDGKMETYKKGLKSDDVYSWTPGQTVGVQ